MKCQILFSGKNKKNITTLSPAKLAQRVVKFKDWWAGLHAPALKATVPAPTYEGVKHIADYAVCFFRLFSTSNVQHAIVSHRRFVISEYLNIKGFPHYLLFNIVIFEPETSYKSRCEMCVRMQSE